MALTYVDVRYLVGNEQTILAATYDDRVFRLAPDGQSWEPAFVGLPNGNVIRDVNGELNGLVMVGNVAFVSFNIDNFPNGYEQSVYRSVDRGVNWTRVSIPLGQATSPMCSHEGIFYCFYYKLATLADPRVGRGFLRTADGGQTWTAVPIDTPNFYTSFERRIAANADWLVMGGPGSSIWRVPTATLTGLEHVALPVSWWRAAEIVEKDGNFIGRGEGYVFSSTTDGQSWFPAGMFQHNVSSLAATSEGVIAGTNQGFLYTSANPFADAAAVSAASYERWVSPESITAFFGSDLAKSTEYCATNPLPTTLGDSDIRVRDFLGGEHTAGLFFVSPNQINAELPGGLALGEATFTINSLRGSSKSGYLRVEHVSPGIFTANGDANGVPAAYILQVSPQGAQKYIPVFRFDSVQKKYVTNPVRLFPNTDDFFLVLYGTGWRGRSSLAAVRLTVQGSPQTVEFAGPSQDFVGLDQINARLAKTFNQATRVFLTVDGKIANDVPISFTQ